MENFINNAPFIVVLLCLIVGFVFLVKGADLFVEGSSSVAKRFKVPSLIIGLTIVAMGTSLPETAVSVAASIAHNNTLAVGIMFAFTYDSLNIYWAIAIIGLTTFVLSIIGVIVGNFFGNKYKKKSEIAGGIILILIGVKILLEHLGIISF